VENTSALNNDHEQKPVKVQAGRRFVGGVRQVCISGEIVEPVAGGEIAPDSDDWLASNADSRSCGLASPRLQLAVKEVQIGEHVLPLAFHTPPTILRRHRVACTPDFCQLMVGENVCNLEGEDDDLFGLGLVDIADDFATELGLMSSGLQCWQNSVSSLGRKKQPLLAESENTPSRHGSGSVVVDKASKAPERAGVQFL
jgi:hypothetical protein